jgi:hypothetical protein
MRMMNRKNEIKNKLDGSTPSVLQNLDNADDPVTVTVLPVDHPPHHNRTKVKIMNDN